MTELLVDGEIASNLHSPVGRIMPSARFAVFVTNDGQRTLVGQLSLAMESETTAAVHFDGGSDGAIDRIRHIVDRVVPEGSIEPQPKSAELALSKIKDRVLTALEAEGFGAEDISAGDHRLSFEFNIDSGLHLGSQEAMHSFSSPDAPIGRKIREAVAGALDRFSNEAAQGVEDATAKGDSDEILKAIQKGQASGAFTFPPTQRLFDALFSFEITQFDPTDRTFIRECRLVVAHRLSLWEAAGMEAEALLQEEVEVFDETQKADLQMVIANASMKKGHRETALHIWRELLKKPDILGPANRGWAWSNIAMALPGDSGDARQAAKYSADAFLEAGLKDQAGRSLMMLANSLLFEQPTLAIDTISAILGLIEQNGLLDRELRAATFHTRANRLAQIGRHEEAARDAQQAVELRRGLIGTEESLISSLHLAAIEVRRLGDSSAADKYEQEADALTQGIKSLHFQLAQRVVNLFGAFDLQSALDVVQEAEGAGTPEIVAYVHVAQAMHDPALTDMKRLSLLENTLLKLDDARVPQGLKLPIRHAIAIQLKKLGQVERAEAWFRQLLGSDPFDIHVRDSLIQILWDQEKWGDAAIVIKKQIDLRGALPGLLFGYGRSLYEAGDYSGATTSLTQALKTAPEGSNVKKHSFELREKALERGGTTLPPASAPSGTTIVTREEFELAIDLFGRFISADKRMTFWTKKGDRRCWVERPERRAQDLLHTFLKARFLERISLFEELDSGAGRLDLYVQLHGGLSLIVELKMCGGGYSSTYAAAGESQLLHYMENRSSKIGYLLVFDAREREFGSALSKGQETFTTFERFIDMRSGVSKKSTD